MSKQPVAAGLLLSALLAQPIALGWELMAGNRPAWSLSSSEVAKIAKGVTVLLDSPNSPGSGVIVAKQGDSYTVMTAAHVVRNRNQKYTIATNDGQRYQISNTSIKSVNGVDLAVVKFTSSRTYNIVKMGNSESVVEGSPVYVAGYPKATSAITRSIYNFTEGKVTANASQPLADGYSIVYSNHTLPGTSGGAVLNENGELIAIHGKGDTAESSKTDPINSQIRIKTGFNLGIATSLINQYAGTLGLGGNSPTANQTIKPGVSRTIARSSGGNADNFVLSAVAKYSRGDASGAIADFSRAIEINPRYAAAYLGRGQIRYITGQLAPARTDLEKSLAFDTKQPLAYSNLCLVYGDYGELQKALASCKEAIRLSPNMAIAYNNLGLIQFQLKETANSLASYNKALQLDPELAMSFNNRGYIYYLQGRNDLALVDYNKALAIDPKIAIAYSNRGLVYYSNSNYSTAIADFTKALNLSPNTALYLHNRGTAYALSGKLPEALVDLDKAVTINPKLALAQQNRGQVLIMLGRKAEGEAALVLAAKLLKEQGDRATYETQIIAPKKP
jgi:tetratricopeptide (TPR) repeat protein